MGIGGSYYNYNIPKAIFYLLRGDYRVCDLGLKVQECRCKDTIASVSALG